MQFELCVLKMTQLFKKLTNFFLECRLKRLQFFVDFFSSKEYISITHFLYDHSYKIYTTTIKKGNNACIDRVCITTPPI